MLLHILFLHIHMWNHLYSGVRMHTNQLSVGTRQNHREMHDDDHHRFVCLCKFEHQSCQFYLLLTGNLTMIVHWKYIELTQLLHIVASQLKHTQANSCWHKAQIVRWKFTAQRDKEHTFQLIDYLVLAIKCMQKCDVVAIQLCILLSQQSVWQSKREREKSLF